MTETSSIDDPNSISRMWDYAFQIATRQKDSMVTPLHLWLGILLLEEEKWPQLIESFGGGTHADAKALLGYRLPDIRDRRQRGRGLSVFRRTRLFLLAMRKSLRRWRLGRSASLRIAASPEAELVARKAYALGGARPVIGHYIIALASMPGEHQAMLRESGAVIVAAVRREVGLLRPGDRLALWADKPRRLMRGLRVRLFNPAPTGVGPLRVGLQVLWWILGAGWMLLRFAVVSVASFYMWVLLLPAAIVGIGLRSLLSLILRVDCRTRTWALPGAEGAVVSPAFAFSRRPAAALLGSRCAVFALGITLVTPFYLRLHAVGKPFFSLLANRPDLLSSPRAPLMFVVDFFATNGIFGGLAFTTGLGCLFLSLPTHRELEQSRLHLGLDFGLRGKFAGRVIAPWAAIVRFGETLESFASWLNGPIYVTLRIIPLLVGMSIMQLLA